MSGVCSCIHLECLNKDKCKRPNNQGEPIDFKFICNEENEYIWKTKVEEVVDKITEE